MLTDIFASGVREKNLVDDTEWGFVLDYSGKADQVISVSPRLAISHPVSKFSFMHYSWGIYTTPPDFSNLLYFYDFKSFRIQPIFRDQNMAPEKSTAWEMGLTVAAFHNAGIDVTVYYRNSNNSDLLTFILWDIPPFNVGRYGTDFGYRDNRGIEATLWKQPSAERLFGIMDLSGTLSMEYAYERTAQDGSYMTSTGGIFQDNPWEQLWETFITADEEFYLDQTDYWPTYSRSNNTYWNLKAALRCDFPWQFELSHIITFRSPWRYRQQLNIGSQRYEKQLPGEYFLQWDLRAAKYFSYRRFGVKLYCDVLNVINRENILTFDTDYWAKNRHYYEQGKGPWGPYGKSTNIYGNLYTGIAREIYLGIELMLR
ncbi:hypothetical protein KAH55_12320 [bacterium]|nr:hypothetical protein [bacterium]